MNNILVRNVTEVSIRPLSEVCVYIVRWVSINQTLVSISVNTVRQARPLSTLFTITKDSQTVYQVQSVTLVTH
jgi:hypothetical protein